jgi:hypothetical protein
VFLLVIRALGVERTQPAVRVALGHHGPRLLPQPLERLAQLVARRRAARRIAREAAIGVELLRSSMST